jgi:hypothetical protein
VLVLVLVLVLVVVHAGSVLGTVSVAGLVAWGMVPATAGSMMRRMPSSSWRCYGV